MQVIRFDTYRKINRKKIWQRIVFLTIISVYKFKHFYVHRNSSHRHVHLQNSGNVSLFNGVLLQLWWNFYPVIDSPDSWLFNSSGPFAKYRFDTEGSFVKDCRCCSHTVYSSKHVHTVRRWYHTKIENYKYGD